MQLHKAKRSQAKIRLCLQGPSGSGKTYTALLIAYGLCGDWNKIAVIDTESNSANLYAHLGEYYVLNLAEFSPEQYVEAMNVCTDAGVEVIILDTISFEWQFLLDYHSNLTGNTFSNWSKVSPRHNLFVQAMLSSPVHIIATTRTKQDYVLADKNGKQVPEKVGLKAVQRDDLDYEFTLVFDLDMRNQAISSKDRTGLFHGKPAQVLSPETGRQILGWCLMEQPAEVNEDYVRVQITGSTSFNGLMDIYNQYPAYQEPLLEDFQKQKEFIIKSKLIQNQLTTQPVNQNGNSKS